VLAQSLVSIDHVLVNLIYLSHLINPDGYDGSVRGLANSTKFANFDQENQNCRSRWFLLHSPSPSEPWIDLSYLQQMNYFILLQYTGTMLWIWLVGFNA
jgi:hypothetical protein